MLNQIKKKFMDWKYLRVFKHPEVENNGLNCDIQLWVEFNKERLIRAITMEERIINGVPVPLEDQIPLDVERDYANMKIGYLKDNDVLDINYLWR